MKQAATSWNGLPYHVISPPRLFRHLTIHGSGIPFHHSNWIICLQFIFYLQTSISDFFYQPACFVFLYYSNDPPSKPPFHQRTIPWYHSTKTTSIIVLSAGLFQGKTLSKDLYKNSFFEISTPWLHYIPYQSTYLTVPSRAPFQPFRHSVPSFRHSPHFAFVYILTIKKLSSFQQTVFSQTWFRQITSQQSIKISNPSKPHSIKKPTFRHSIIPGKGVEGPTLCQETEVPSYTVCDCHQSPCNGY